MTGEGHQTVPVVLDGMFSKFLGLLLLGYTVYITLLTASEGNLSRSFLIRMAIYLLLALPLIFVFQF
jgi:hypothetical protein